MTGWTALVPIRPAPARKTRLAALDNSARLDLTERMLDHVIAVAAAHPAIDRVVLLAEAARAGSDWIADGHRGLNGECEAARAKLGGNLLILHADLALLAADDITALLALAQTHGAAIAADRHGTGTNAVALTAGHPFAFRFGPGSRALHEAQLPPGAVLTRPGLAIDIDTPDDLGFAGL